MAGSYTKDCAGWELPRLSLEGQKALANLKGPQAQSSWVMGTTGLIPVWLLQDILE